MLDAERAAANGQTGDGDQENLRQIQEILFGRERRDFERRVAALDEVLRAQVKDLRSSSREQLSRVESLLREQIEKLDARVDSEIQDRTAEQAKFSAEVCSTLAGFEASMDERFEALSSKLDHEIGGMREQLDVRTTEITLQFESARKQLESAKLDRKRLSKLFGGLAEALVEDDGSDADEQ